MGAVALLPEVDPCKEVLRGLLHLERVVHAVGREVGADGEERERELWVVARDDDRLDRAVREAEQVRLAKEAGAQYIISPNVSEAVIRETKALGLVSIPGAMTPTEIANAYAWGADIVKVFPAGVLGAAYIKAVRAPLNHIPMVAVGGVSPDNIADFIAVGCVGAGCGGNLVSKKIVEEGKFSEITRTALAYKAALAK